MGNYQVNEARHVCAPSCAGYFLAVQTIHPVISDYFTISTIPAIHISCNNYHGCQVKVTLAGDHTSCPSQAIPAHLTPRGRLKPVNVKYDDNSNLGEKYM